MKKTLLLMVLALMICSTDALAQKNDVRKSTMVSNGIYYTAEEERAHYRKTKWY